MDPTTGGRVTVEHTGGTSCVWLDRPDQERVLVFEAACMVAAPAVLCGPEGHLVAFHHDLREDSLATDVAKWIALRLVRDGGEVLEPAAPMTGRDRDLDARGAVRHDVLAGIHVHGRIERGDRRVVDLHAGGELQARRRLMESDRRGEKELRIEVER